MDRAHLESESDSAVAVSAEPVLAWKVHLLKEEPAKVLLIAPVVFASLLACYIIFRNPLPLAVILFLFASSLAEYLFPIHYEISRRGASMRTPFGRTYIGWDRVNKCYVDDRGIKLSPLGKPGRLEAYRGVYLRFGDRAYEVKETVRRMRDG
jgi:hypothetical protein